MEGPSSSNSVRVQAPKKKKRPFMIHIKTRNISFLQTAKDLKELGIKNNVFFLKLYDRDLEFVDPYDPNLTPDIMIKILNECTINPWYFLRECVRIPEQGGNGIPYQLHRANLASTFCFLNGIDHYLVIPRQKGKTQSTIAILNWSFLFGTTNSEFMFINKRQDDANNNLDRLKQQRDILPSFMRMKEIINDDGKLEKGQDNVKTITNPTTGNKVVTKPSARSVEAAEGLGRGCTQPIQYYDEVEFTPFIKTIIEAAGPAFNTASANAKRNHAAYCRVFTSTPGDLDTQPGEDSLKIIEETCKWTEKMYDWPRDDIDDYIKKNAGNGIVYIEYHYQQLGDDEEWFTRTCQTLLNNPVKIKREIFLQRMRGSSDSPFEPEELDAIQEFKGKVKEEIFINKLYKLDVYDDIVRDRVYIVGVDCAQGLGEDSTALTVLDPYTVKPIAEFKSPYIGIADASKFLETLIRKYLPRSILVVERNNVGEAIMDNLRQTPIRNSIYFDNSREFIGHDDHLDNHGFLKRQAAARKMYGVYTSKKSREIMMTILEAHVRDHKQQFVTENIINDLLSLVRKKSGRIEHAVGFHDDSLFSYLLALYVYYHGNNLSRYGFVRGQLPDEDNRNKGLSYQEIYNEMPQELKEYFPEQNMVGMEEYYDRMKHEIQSAQRESDMVNEILNPVNGVQNMDRNEYDMEGSIDLDLFDYLND
jgi:hypothetical protein